MNTFFRLFSPIGLVAFASCTDIPAPTIPAPIDGAAAMNQVAWIGVCCSGTFYVGASANFQATAYGSNGQPLSGQSFYWTSDDPSVATVGGGGNIGAATFHSTGYTTLRAHSGSAVGGVTIQVVTPPNVVASVQVSPSPAEVDLGTTTQLIARAYNAQGGQITGRPVTWSIANPGIATISSTGTLYGVSLGSTTATATIDGVTTTVPVTVYPPFSVAIQGPEYVWTQGWHSWQAVATGGNGTYSYRWSIDESYQITPLGTYHLQDVDVGPNTAPFFIMNVEVTSGGRTKVATLGVCNFSVSAIC